MSQSLSVTVKGTNCISVCYEHVKIAVTTQEALKRV